MANNPTRTLQQLRRLIASDLQMPFARKFPKGYSTLNTGSTTTKVIDSLLVQKIGFWDGGWFYHVPTQSQSLIYAYTPVSNSFQLEMPTTGTPVAGDQYEIHNIFNAADIISSINRSIGNAAHVFINTITDTSLIMQQNDLTYDLTGLAFAPWIVTKVWIENKPMMRGGIVSATSNTATLDINVQSTLSIPTNYILSIYAGTGRGQQMNVSSVSGAQLTLATSWTTQPDSTSLYALWDKTYELQDWILKSEYHLNAKEWPTNLIFNVRNTAYYGARIRIEYMGIPNKLSAETDTTIVPEEYIIPKAMSILYRSRSKDTKVDQKTFQDEAIKLDKMAEDYLMRNYPRKPDIQLKTPTQTDTYIENDPLGWNVYRGGVGK
jgi:hypothetical protein